MGGGGGGEEGGWGGERGLNLRLPLLKWQSKEELLDTVQWKIWHDPEQKIEYYSCLP